MKSMVAAGARIVFELVLELLERHALSIAIAGCTGALSMCENIFSGVTCTV
jgi:hypothetical protein